jgi:hypothetical protein
MFHFGIRHMCMYVHTYIHLIHVLTQRKKEIIKGYILSCIRLELFKNSNLSVCMKRRFGVLTEKADGLVFIPQPRLSTKQKARKGTFAPFSTLPDLQTN